MVDYEFVIDDKDLIVSLKEAREYSKRVGGEEKRFVFAGENLGLRIQDDFLMVETANGGWIAITPEDFSSEMMILLLEGNTLLATEEVLQALLRAAGIE
jgi:hypothetical protein